MLELKVFQSDSAKLISDRYAYFSQHPDRPRKGQKARPFFQALSALTGAGKTPILADAISRIRPQLVHEPIVFWISRAKSVVAQTLNNFSAGGKYSEIVDGFRVTGIGGLNPSLIKDLSTPLLVLATTGLFNNKDQSDGALNIYKPDNDIFGDQSPWQRLIERGDGKTRRPLFIVYDEGHNLSEQQTELLGELEPDAYIVASATLRLPPTFAKSVVQPVRLWVEELDDIEALENLRAISDGKPDAENFITTTVDSAKVVEAELVKRAIQFDGTTATMERSLDDLYARMQLLDSECTALGVKFKPKAISAKPASRPQIVAPHKSPPAADKTRPAVHKPAPVAHKSPPAADKTRPAVHKPAPVAHRSAPVGDITGPQLRILEAIRFWHALDIDRPTRDQVGAATVDHFDGRRLRDTHDHSDRRGRGRDDNCHSVIVDSTVTRPAMG